MTERITGFLPSILILTCIAGLTSLYLKLVTKHLLKNLKKIEWYEKNQLKFECLLGIPAIYIFVPIQEELIFRAPLILIFSGINGNAWTGILVSAFAFATSHYFGNQIKLFDGQVKTDDIKTGIAEIEKMEAQQIKIRRLLHVVCTFPLGVLAGYYGIKYQSIWISVGIHSVWNLLMPILMPLLVILPMVVAFSSIKDAWNKQRRRKQYQSLKG
ncbi:MAG: CPBP family intramembrane metalloprotease [Candidatus Yanofskybacteria bacterium]|nr:CPBP family intramembrane metalloprotease [Candidatus Yanofskybacteria bacterium]